MPKIYKITEADKTQPSRLDQIIQQEFEHRLKPGASMMIDPKGGDKFEELTYGYGAHSFINEHTLYSREGTITIPDKNLFEFFKAGFFTQNNTTSSLADIKPLKGSYISGFRDQNGQEYLVLNETATPNSDYAKLVKPETFTDVAPKDEKQKQPLVQPRLELPPEPLPIIPSDEKSSSIPVIVARSSLEEKAHSSPVPDTCYSILGVEPTASQKEIQSAYKLATKNRAANFEIKQSFKILSKPSKKLIYDHSLKTYQDHTKAKGKAEYIRSENTDAVTPQSQKDFFIYKINSSAKATIDQLSELELEERLDYSEEHNTPFICEQYRGIHQKFDEETEIHTFKRVIKNDKNLFEIHHSQLVQSFQNELFPRVPVNNPYAQTPLPDETLYGGLLTENGQTYYVVHVHKNNKEALKLIQQLDKNSCELISTPSLQDRKTQSPHLNPPPSQESVDKYQCLKKYGLFACVGIGATVAVTTVITANVQMALCIAALTNAQHEALLNGTTLGQLSLHRAGEINAGTAVGIAIDVLVPIMCYLWHRYSKNSEEVQPRSSVTLSANSRLET